MRCLYIVSRAPISPHYRGGSSAIYYEQLASLAELGHEIHLWHFAYESERQSYNQFVATDPEIWHNIQAMCRSVTLTTLPQQPTLWQKLQDRWAHGGHPPLWHGLRTLARTQLKSLIAQIKPDFIWGQHLWPAQVAVMQRDIPVVFSHHDWLFRIKALRNRQAESQRMRYEEEQVALQATAITSGSQVECEQLQQLGCRHVTYIPIAYHPFQLDLATIPAKTRLVHFGGLATTATRVGLERFFQIVWPQFQNDPFRPEFYAVGDITPAEAELAAHLAQVICTGHVTNWATVLRPYDIHLIPWEHSTGQRTRLPVAFNFAQVVVAVRAGIAGYPEAQDGVNCRLVDRIEEMAGVIRELMSDSEQRIRLGRAARETFEKSFTRPGLLPRYQQLLETISPLTPNQL